MVVLAGGALFSLWPRDGVDDVVAAGERHFSAGRLEAAAEAAVRALAVDPNHAGALFLSGRVELKADRPTSAAALLSRIPANQRLFGRAQYPLAQALLADAEWDRAVAVLAERVTAAPDDAAAGEELRWLYFNLFRTRDVLRLLGERLDRGDDTVLPDLLDSEFRSQVPHEALAYLEPVFERRSDQGLVAAAMGYCRWKTGRIDEGRTLLAKALALRPDDRTIRQTLAESLLELGEVDAAESTLSAVAEPASEETGSDAAGGRDGELDGLAADHWALRSRIAERRRDLQAAGESLDRALRLAPYRREFLTRRAALLRLQGMSDLAVEAAARAGNVAEAERRLRSAAERGLPRSRTPENCRTMAALCRETGRLRQADVWDRLAEDSSGRR